MAIASFEGGETRLYADVSWRLIDAETQARDLDGRVGKGEGIRKGEVRGRHGGVIVVFFCLSSAFVCCLELSR